MKNYKIQVLFRYVDNGEQKGSGVIEVEAENFEEASDKALLKFKTISNAIPFAVKNLEV